MFGMNAQTRTLDPSQVDWKGRPIASKIMPGDQPDVGLGDFSSRPRGMFGAKAPRTRIEAIGGTDPGLGDGSAARPGFDYEAALAKLMPPERKPNTLRQIAGIVGPALMGAVGNQEGANAFLQMQAQRRAAHADTQRRAAETVLGWQRDDWKRQDDRDWDINKPVDFSGENDRVRFDPRTGESTILYDAPNTFEEYGEALGYEPGTEEYFTAVEDYVLRGNGPSAIGYDKDLDDYRTGNRLEIEGVRQGNRESLEGLRQRNRVSAKGSPSYRDLNPAPRRSARPTATGPGGQKVEWDGKAWVPAN